MRLLTIFFLFLISASGFALASPAPSLAQQVAGGVAQPATKVESYGEQLCLKPGLHCIKVKQGDTWSSLFPDNQQRDLVMRLNRTNVPLRFRPWIIVPDDLANTEYLSLSPLPEKIHPPGRQVLIVDLGQFAFGAYDEQGNLLRWGPASGGQTWCDDDRSASCETRLGEFKIYRIQGAQCISSEYPKETGGGAPMPYCMHYYRGFALHGSTLSGFLNRSKGCIRLFTSDAKWLTQQFASIGTLIYVHR